MGLAARNPDYQRAVRDGFSRQPFMAYLGADITDLRPGHVEIRVPYREEVGQNHGFFHGGVIGAIADVCGGAPNDHNARVMKWAKSVLATIRAQAVGVRAR